ncbi:hypothetical protein Hanom_Chr14g01246901 [Helianthus anomalus]
MGSKIEKKKRQILSFFTPQPERQGVAGGYPLIKGSSAPVSNPIKADTSRIPDQQSGRRQASEEEELSLIY